MHLGCQLTRFLVHLIAGQQSWDKFLTGIVTINLEGKGGQGHEIDAVFLDGTQVGVAQTEAQHITDTGVIAC